MTFPFPFLSAGGDKIEIAAAHQSSTTSGILDNVQLPPGIEAGELLIVLQTMSFGGITYVNPSGWTRLLTTSGAAAIQGWYKVASGSEGATLALPGNGGSALTRALSFRIRNFVGAPEGVANPSPTSSPSPTPPSISPSWGLAKTLWMPVAYANNATLLTAYPDGYGAPDAIVNNNQFAASWRIATEASENPGAYIFDATNGSRAATIAIRSK